MIAYDFNHVILLPYLKALQKLLRNQFSWILLQGWLLQPIGVPLQLLLALSTISFKGRFQALSCLLFLKWLIWWRRYKRIGHVRYTLSGLIWIKSILYFLKDFLLDAMFHEILKHDETFLLATWPLYVLRYEILTFYYSFWKALYYSTADLFQFHLILVIHLGVKYAYGNRGIVLKEADSFN